MFCVTKNVIYWNIREMDRKDDLPSNMRTIMQLMSITIYVAESYNSFEKSSNISTRDKTRNDLLIHRPLI